ncbi:hypothetical protein GU254_09480 [Vibrio cholerae]|uniref:hypothetical protein n=1 Tax=Vibrio paracholerae TaxID=650003 RepID=UPI0019D29118|nr:hypothetical protein [Vibrio paracholerae]MBN7278988.1 hypothetical protein [Vibrio paracholerae]MBN7283024.1 hypothetical protein [Vibrio paracholerae]
MKDKAKILNDLKKFYVEYLGCADVPIKNGRDTTAARFANSLAHCVGTSQILSNKSDHLKREREIIKYAQKLLELMEDRPSGYMSDHMLYDKESLIPVVRPKLQVAAIIEGSQERLERLKATQAKRSDLMKGIQFMFNSGGYPELQDKELNAQTLATLILYLTGQGVFESDTLEERDKKDGKWYDLETGIRVAQSDSIEYKEAVKFLKNQ